MSEKTRAWVNLILNMLGAGVAAALTCLATDSTGESFKKPFVWLTIVGAMLTVLRATFNETPASGKIMDVKIERAAQIKTADQIGQLMESGAIKVPENRP